MQGTGVEVIVDRTAVDLQRRMKLCAPEHHEIAQMEMFAISLRWLFDEPLYKNLDGIQWDCGCMGSWSRTVESGLLCLCIRFLA